MNHCPSCDRKFKDSLTFCPFDGVVLLREEEHDDLLGKVLDGKFRLIEKVGEGGMGKVYKAKHLHLDHTVAIKILHGHLSSDKMMLERFRREAQAAIYVRHPNAVAVTDFGVTADTGLAYLVMEFLKGVELRDRIRQQKQLPYEELLLVTRDTCSALQAAHARGVVHRDLKPENIWLIKSEDGGAQVKVLDFGIAKFKLSSDVNQLTQQGTVIGTPLYMSPEQCCGDDLDGRSDIYSLGVILYEMLTGQVPFKAPHLVGVIFKHLHEAPPEPSLLRPDIPAPVKEVVMRALNKERNERQQSASQLALELEMAIYGAGLKPETVRIHTPAAAIDKTVLPISPPQDTSQAKSDGATGSGSWASSGDFQIQAEERSDAGYKTTPDAPQPFVSRPAPPRVYDSLEQKASTESNDTGFHHGRKTINFQDVLGGSRRNLMAGIAVALIVVIVIIIRATGPDKPDEGVKKPSAAPTPPPGMVHVQGGKFKMGTDNPAADEPSSGPANTIAVKEFFLDATEVTNEQYKAFIDATGRRAPEHWDGNKYPPLSAQFPVYNVSWEDARDYAKWANKRLPTEAEWEYAARGPESLQFPWGGGWSQNKANLKESGVGGTGPVGSFPEGNSWCGAYDLVGNVAEWVYDSYSPYRNGPGTSSPGARVVRGGSFNDSKDKPWAILRRMRSPNSASPEIGFRCAKDIE